MRFERARLRPRRVDRSGTLRGDRRSGSRNTLRRPTIRSTRTSPARSPRRCSRSCRSSRRWRPRRCPWRRSNCSMQLVHGEQDFRFHRPIRPGDELVGPGQADRLPGPPERHRRVARVRSKPATPRANWSTSSDMTAFFRKVDAGAGEGEARAGTPVRRRAPRAGPGRRRRTQHIDDDQTFRYSPASGDPMPIHLDERDRADGRPARHHQPRPVHAWRSRRGRRSPNSADRDVERLRRLAVRFAKPVLPGQDITTRVPARRRRRREHDLRVRHRGRRRDRHHGRPRRDRRSLSGSRLPSGQLQRPLRRHSKHHTGEPDPWEASTDA